MSPNLQNFAQLLISKSHFVFRQNKKDLEHGLGLSNSDHFLLDKFKCRMTSLGDYLYVRLPSPPLWYHKVRKLCHGIHADDVLIEKKVLQREKKSPLAALTAWLVECKRCWNQRAMNAKYLLNNKDVIYEGENSNFSRSCFFFLTH